LVDRSFAIQIRIIAFFVIIFVITAIFTIRVTIELGVTSLNDFFDRLTIRAEVERALLVVEVLKAPDPELLGLSVGNSLEHFDVV